MSAVPQFINTIKNLVARIQNADASNLITLLTGAGNGMRVHAIAVSSDDTSSRVVQLVLTVSAVDYVLGEVTIPAGAGTDGSTKAVDLLNLTDLPWLQTDGVKPYLDVANGSTLKVKSKTTVTAAKAIHFVGVYGDL